MARSTVHWGGLEGLDGELRRYLRRRCRDASEVDDVVQETLLRAARYRPSMLEPDRIGRWGQRVAANVLRDRRRRESRVLTSELEPEAYVAAPAAQAEAVAEDRYLMVEGRPVELDLALRHLRGALAEMREGDRRVLRSYYRSSGGTASVARELGIARGLVKVRLYRARQRLGRELSRRLSVERAEAVGT